MVRLLVWGVLGIAAVLGLAILNNNISWFRPTKNQLMERLEQARQASRNWFLGRDNSSRETVQTRRQEFFSNTALLHIVADCAQASGDDELRQFVHLFFELHQGRHVWSRLIDPEKPFELPSDEALSNLQEYQRWILHAVSRGVFALAPEDKASLFHPRLHARVHLTHQVLALYLYRQFIGSTPEIDRLLPQLAKRISWEAALDFRVTDLYLQRIVCLLISSQTQSIKPRWIERALAAQKSDGGWTYGWHGWDTSLFRYRWRSEPTTAHPTAQGLWIICLLKYRHPDWIERCYHE